MTQKRKEGKESVKALPSDVVMFEGEAVKMLDPNAARILHGAVRMLVP